MKVTYVRKLRQRTELLPSYNDRALNLTVDFEFPLVERNLGLQPQVEHRPIMDLSLARREAVV